MGYARWRRCCRWRGDDAKVYGRAVSKLAEGAVLWWEGDGEETGCACIRGGVAAVRGRSWRCDGAAVTHCLWAEESLGRFATIAR